MGSWVAQLANLMGYVHNHQAPARSQTSARMHVLARDADVAGHNCVHCGLVRSPQQQPRVGVGA